MKKSNLGEFDSLKSVWEKYPHGGIEGDIITIRGVLHEWDKYSRTWGKPSSPAESDSNGRREIDGHLSVDGNLYIGGRIFAKNLTQTSCGLFATLEDLKSAFPDPKEGMWANVGNTMPSPIYRCGKTGQWEPTGEVGGVEIPDREIILDQIQEAKRQIERTHLSKADADKKFDAFLSRLGVVRFDGFIDDCSLESVSIGSSDGLVVYCRSLRTFVLKQSNLSGDRYYNNWTDSENYRHTALSEPYNTKLYFHDGYIYFWAGGTLEPINILIGEGERDAFAGDRGKALESSVSELQEKSRDIERGQSQVEKELSDLAKKGSGSGHYNVTLRHPLSEGYYTLESAVAAISSSDVAEEERRGKVMTFEVAAGKWVDYRYTGDRSSEQFSSPAFWVVASSIKGVRVGGQLVEPQDGVIDLPDSSIEVADSVDESDRPVTARAVKGELDHIKALTLDSDTEQTDEGTQVTLSQEGRQVAQFTVAGGGGGGEGSATKAKVTAQLSANRIKLGDAVQLSYGYTHYTDGEQDGLPADLKVIIRRGVQEVAEIGLGSVASGESRTLSLGQYLTVAASYNISVVASYVEGDKPKTRTAAAQVSVVDLAIELYNRSEIQTYLSAGGYRDGDTANIIVAVKGGARELSMYIDGESQAHEVKALSGSGGRQTFILPLRTLSAGAHSIQLVARLDSIVSNSIYLDILKAGDHQPFVGLIFSRSDGRIFRSGETPELLAQQYLGCQWEYIAIGSGSGVATLSLHTPSGAKTFSAPRSYQVVKDRFLTRGSLAYRYELEGVSKPLNISVVPTEIEGIGIKEGAALELIASGRSNAEANPAQWQSGAYSAVFEGVDFRGSGWTGDALRLINGAKVRIGYKPFNVDAKTNGLTIIAEIKTNNVRRADEAVLSSYDREGHTSGAFGGFLVNPYEVKIPLGGRVEFRSEEGEVVQRDLEVKAPYTSGVYTHIAIVIHPEADHKNVRVYLDGDFSKADVYQDTIFRQRTPQDIVLDSTAADLEIRHLRVYGTALTDDEVLRNYITDRQSLQEMEALRDRNDVLDPQTGQPSWDKLIQKGVGVLNICMDGGLEKLWGKSTDTKTKYAVKEVIFHSPLGRAYDMKIEVLVMGRQGTSTSTYPAKNNRGESTAETKMYRNVGGDGEYKWELVEDKSYTMRPGAKKMFRFNIKVDYADSSLQNNIGGARLWNKLCREIPSLTNPGMQADPEARAALDGVPCCLFTSDTPDGEKRFMGTAMFNFDKKGSGYIFGQTKEGGTEIALEGINNTNAIANFRLTEDAATQLARTDADGFDASFEFLYPEKKYKWKNAPSNIKQSVTRLMQWIKDCTPAGVDPSRMATAEVVKKFKSAKFKGEVAQYFSVQSLCAWYVWTDYMMAVDQRAKNTFWRCWDGLKWWITYYDGDSSWRKRNEAMLAYIYNITRDTWDAERNKWAFEGHNSILWCLVLANLEEELRAIAVDMRRVMTDEVVREYVNNPLRDFPLVVHNKSNIKKYVEPTYIDYNGGGTMNYIFALDGTMRAAKEDIIVRRFSLLDARYNPEDSVRRDNVPCYIGKGAVPTTIIVHAGDEYYFGWATQNGVTRQYERVETGASLTLNFPDAISQNDPVRLAGASRMRRIDLSTTAPYMQGAMNLNTCRMLEELIAPISSGQGLPWFMLLGSISGLKRIDLTGQSAVTGTESAQSMTFDVSSHTGLMELKLSGTAVRAIRLAEGAPISRLELPATLSYLRLRALPKLTEAGLQVTDWSAIRSLELAGCPQLNWRTLLDKCTALEALRIEGVDMEDDGTMLERLMRVRGLDANGSGLATCSLVGRCQLTTYIDDELFKRYQAHFPELDILQPPYTVIEFDETVDDPANISNLDNKTGYKFGNKYEVSGHIGAILKARFACLGKQAVKGVMQVCKLHDYDLRRYADHVEPRLATESLLDGTQGDVWIYEPRYWYKGVNDVLGHKKYACYAYGRKPPSPKGKRITIEEIRAQGGLYEGKSVRSIGNDASNFMFADNPYSVIKASVRGFKRVRFPSATSDDNKCAAFCDASGAVLERISIEQNDLEFSSGMYLVKEVPERAEYIYTNIFSEVTDDFIWLSNSEEIVDMEPDWVEHKPQLVALFCPSLINGKITSTVKYGQPERAFRGAHVDTFESLCADRGMQMCTYNTNKDIINLGFAKFGTRDLVLVKTNGNTTLISGEGNDMLATGMQDHYLKSSGDIAYMTYREGRLVEDFLRPGRWTEKLLGYEGFYSMSFEILGGLNITSGGRYFNAHFYNRYRVTRQDGKEQIIKAKRSYRIIVHTYHGLYMDVIPVSSNTDKSHNYTQRYRDRCNFWEVVEGIWYVKDSAYRPLSSDYVGPLFINGHARNVGTRWTGEWHSIRLEFNGEIKVVQDVEEFKEIKATV